MKKCPQCGRAYSDFVQQCPTCKIALADQQAVQRDPAVELGGGAGSSILNGAGQTVVQPPIQPPAQQPGSGTYPGGGTQGSISQNCVQNIPVTYANRHQFQPTPEEEFIISAHGGDCGIKKYVGNRAMVVIPAKIRGHRVVSIDKFAFYRPRGIFGTGGCRVETVIIPESVGTIGMSAFDTCKELTTVIAHPYIENLGDSAFLLCANMKVLDFGIRPTVPGVLYLPQDMKNIGYNLFGDGWSGCGALPFQEVWLSRKTKLRTSLGSGRSFTKKACAIYYYEDDHR